MRGKPKERQVRRVGVDFLCSSAQDDAFFRQFHGLLQEGIRRGFVLSYSMRRQEKIPDHFPDEGLKG